MSALEPRYPLLWPDAQPRTDARNRRAYSRFQVTPGRATKDLLEQVARLGGANPIISSWLAVRNDGQPYADQARRKIPDPGVAVYFTLNGRRQCIAVDIYDNVFDNIRAIGLAIDALRALERHGGGQLLTTAMDGFASLPPPSAPQARPWFEVLQTSPAASTGEIRDAYRRAAKRTHPDAGGSEGEFQEVQQAYADAMETAA